MTLTATLIPPPKFTITPKAVVDAQGLFNLGNSDPENSVTGGYMIHFAMDVGWVGSIAVLARPAVHKAGFDDTAFVGPWPFRAFYLNGQPSDGSMVSGASAQITNTSTIVIPATLQEIGLEVNCSQGSCTMYYQPFLGPSIP